MFIDIMGRPDSDKFCGIDVITERLNSNGTVLGINLTGTAPHALHRIQRPHLPLPSNPSRVHSNLAVPMTTGEVIP